MHAQKAQKTKNTKGPKSTKKHQKALKAQKHNQAIAKNANKQTNIKNVLKNIYGEKSHLFAYLRFRACKEKNKSLYNGNFGPTKLVQKIVC